jgi:hypothetical protein
MKFTGTTVLKLKDGLIVEEIGLDDGVAAFDATRTYKGCRLRQTSRLCRHNGKLLPFIRDLMPAPKALL